VCGSGHCVGGNAKIMPLTQIGEFYYIVLPILGRTGPHGEGKRENG